MSADEYVAAPYSVPEQPSSVCSTGLLPHILTGTLLQIMQHHFSEPSNIVQEKLKSYVWTPEAQVSRILIEAGYNWSPENIQQRPAVVVKRGQLKTTKMSMGNIFHGAPDLDGYDEEKMIVAFQGSHSLFCVGRTGTEAEELGAEVAYELLEFSQIIRKQFNFMLFELFEIGQVCRLQESNDHFAVPVTVTYAYSHGWTVLRQRPLWMSVGLQVNPSS